MFDEFFLKINVVCLREGKRRIEKRKRKKEKK